MEKMTLKECETIEECREKWKEDLLADPSLVIKGANGEPLLGRYEGAESSTGWEQSMTASRRQKSALSNDEEIQDFANVTDGMMSAFTTVLFSGGALCAVGKE